MAKAKNTNLAGLLVIGAILAVILVTSQGGLTGFAAGENSGKTGNSVCARDCAQICHDGAMPPVSGVADLSISSCIQQCMTVQCPDQKVIGGKCDFQAPADSCCNVFSAVCQDPDCTYGVDQDHDTFSTVTCGGGGLDCNDANPAINPAAPEVCNEIDDNCNGNIDEGAGPSTFYGDPDGDGYGNDFDTNTACFQPEGYVPTPGDCNDFDFDVNPGATEICGDFTDQDCDGFDQECPAAAPPIFG